MCTMNNGPFIMREKKQYTPETKASMFMNQVDSELSLLKLNEIQLVRELITRQVYFLVTAL